MKVNKANKKDITSAKNFLHQFEFLSLIIRLIILLMIYINNDEFIFSGLGLISNQSSTFYSEGRRILLVGISFNLLFTLLDLVLIYVGILYNYSKASLVNCYFSVFGNIILVYFYIDSWHFVTIWYIFISSV